MATQVMTNHHHVTFSGSSQALRHSSPGPTTSYSANGLMMNGSSNGYANGASLTAVEHDNPFRPGSELIEDAENILKSVTIVGSQVIVASNDSGIGASSPKDRSPISASRTNDLQCSTILSTTTSTPGPTSQQKPSSTDPCVVVRASPESLRPDSPLRAEHVVVSSHGGVKASPKKNDDTVDQTAADNATSEDPSKADKKKKKKGKKRCLLL